MTLFSGTPVTLAQLLRRREARAAGQRQWLEECSLPVVCLCVNMPGAVKQNEAARRSYAAGEQALLAALAEGGFAVDRQHSLQAPTGYEGMFAVDAPAGDLKALCINIEETHPLGRLFDLDVIGPDGAPLSRTALGHPPRRCLVCGAPAARCTGRAPHPLAQVCAAIATLLEDAANGT